MQDFIHKYINDLIDILQNLDHNEIEKIRNVRITSYNVCYMKLLRSKNNFSEPENSIDPNFIISFLPATAATENPLAIALPNVHKSGFIL